MAACTNNGGSIAKRAVTAALVGVLSVGTVPMAALAEGVSDGIQTMVADWSTDAKVTAAEDGKGSAFTGDLSKPVSFDLGSGKYLVPTEVTGQAGKTDIDPNEFDVYYKATKNSTNWDGLNATSGVYQYVNSKGETVQANYAADQWLDADAAAAYFSGDLTDTAGKAITVAEDTYTVKVVEKNANPQTANGVTMTFKLAAEDKLASAYVYNAADGDTSDTTFTYNGQDQSGNVKLALEDGTPVTGGSMVIRNKDGVAVNNSSLSPKGVVNAGDYTVEYTSSTGKVYNYKFTVNKWDLSTANLTVEDQLASDLTGSVTGDVATRNTAILSLMKIGDRSLTSSEKGLLDITDVKGPNGTTYFDPSVKGEYTFTVEEKKDDSNIENTATITFSILDSSIYSSTVKLYYGSQDTNSNHTVSVNLTKGESFDASQIKVREDDGTPSWSGDQLEISYYDQNAHKTVDASALTKAGNYTVTVRVKPFQDQDGKWVGGTETFDVVVSGDEAFGDNVSFYLDGELSGSKGELTFDGTDLLGRLTAKVSNPAGGTFEAGKDFTLEAKNVDTGKVVDSVTDAGKYEIVVKPVTFKWGTGVSASDYTFTLDVKQLAVTTLHSYTFNGDSLPINPSTGDYPNGYVNDAVAWTGSAVEVPAVQYENADGDLVTLDKSLYNVVSIKDESGKVVKEAVDDGTYTVRIALSDAAKSNYSLADREFDFQVVKYSPFDDVESPAWYASVVADAKYTNIVNGMSGTNLFAPEAQISRADAVCIIFNMAGGDNALGDYEYSQDKGWVTGFDDVDGNAYYAKALAWAHNAGVVNGYDGAFRPTDKVTREELAAMIANYAKATGKFQATDGTALAGMSDASTVSGWAEGVVDWAVENGIMGNGGYVAGQSNITRAEVAAMAVNYTGKF